MKNTLLTIWNFYLEGFRSMTLGRTLWVIILLKLFVMFFILKMFFFPDFLGDHPTDADKGTYVGNELIERAIPADRLVESPICDDSHVPLDFCSPHTRTGSGDGNHGDAVL